MAGGTATVTSARGTVAFPAVGVAPVVHPRVVVPGGHRVTSLTLLPTVDIDIEPGQQVGRKIRGSFADVGRFCRNKL